MELELRTSTPAHATGTVEFVPIEAIASDATFRVRAEGDVSTLAASIGRLGQLVPIELRPIPGAGPEGVRWQVVAGVRRIAALHLLQRDRVLARVHGQLSDEDAWGLALTQALLAEPLLEAELEALRPRLLEEGQASWAHDLIDEALVRAPVDPELREKLLELVRAQASPAIPVPDETAPSGDAAAAPSQVVDQNGTDEDPFGVEGEQEQAVELTPEELADSLTTRLFDINQEIAAGYEAWSDLPARGRLRILEQMRYLAEMSTLLERKR